MRARRSTVRQDQRCWATRGRGWLGPRNAAPGSFSNHRKRMENDASRMPIRCRHGPTFALAACERDAFSRAPLAAAPPPVSDSSPILIRSCPPRGTVPSRARFTFPLDIIPSWTPPARPSLPPKAGRRTSKGIILESPLDSPADGSVGEEGRPSRTRARIRNLGRINYRRQKARYGRGRI